jgi:putative tryptophan/tyrosine transport system substrate-binding protein
VRIFTGVNPKAFSWKGLLQTINTGAQALGVRAVPASVDSAAMMENAVDAFVREPGGGMIVLPSTFMTVHRERVVALAARHRLPAVYPLRFFVTSGGLMSYGSDPVEPYRQAAAYVARILKGEKPGDLPVQAPTKYELAINLKTAKALGLDVPPTLLARADEVIE